MPTWSFSTFEIPVPTPLQLVWSLIGLLLTVGGTFLEASIANFPWDWPQQGVKVYSLGVTYQVGAVLFVGCLGGKTAAFLSQVSYILLGLTWFPIFAKGGGWDYIWEPTFGYILGFVLGGWLCGVLSFWLPPRLEFLAISCLSGLLAIHAVGVTYLGTLYALQGKLSQSVEPFWQDALIYSWNPLGSHAIVACAIAAIAFFLRHILFY